MEVHMASSHGTSMDDVHSFGEPERGALRAAAFLMDWQSNNVPERVSRRAAAIDSKWRSCDPSMR